MTFFRGLKKNNRREWFQPRKEQYDTYVKQPMTELIGAIFEEMMRFAPAYVGEPEKTIYRIYRDTRFSKDKTPYKTHIAAVFPRRGLCKHGGAGFYFSVSADEIEVCGGVYMPGPDELRCLRLHMMNRHEEFRKICAARSLKTLMGEVQGESLTRPPKGFPVGHDADDLIRRKQYLLWKTLDPELALTPQLQPEIVKRFRAMAPWLDFLNEPLVRSPVNSRVNRGASPEVD